jgi:hypothetical protein
LEGHKVREVHRGHGSLLSLDVKQRPCHHPGVHRDISAQKLAQEQNSISMVTELLMTNLRPMLGQWEEPAMGK